MSQRHNAALDFKFHARQSIALKSEATEILYGGAAGGGKSHLMRLAAVMWASEIAGIQIYLFRRIHEDLVKNHMEGPNGFRTLLARWVDAGFVTIVENEIRFWNGSKIYLCHCQHEKDRFKYQGAEIHVLMIDELTHFTEVIYRFLRNRVRKVGLKVPEKYQGLFPRIVCGSNPGNVGHQWVKSAFIDNTDDLQIRQMPKGEGGMKRQFIVARLEDNPSMMEEDPDYEARLEGLGSEATVKAMRWGDWNIVEGAFFDNFSIKRHVLRPVDLPKHWTRFRAGDWGYAKPFSFGWYAVATDDWQHPDGPVIPRGALVRYREWYGVKTNADGSFEADTGYRLEADDAAEGIKEREAGENIDFSVLDPGAFITQGGPSIGETFFLNGISFRKADNARVARSGAIGGWDQVRARLTGNQDGHPMLFLFSSCRHAIRTIPVLQHDENRPEDLMTASEDHAADEVRYACMSRPWMAEKPKQARKKIEIRQQTIDEMVQDHTRSKRYVGNRI